MKAPWIFALCVGFIAALGLLLPTRPELAHSEGMKTLTKAKTPARKLSMSPAAVRARRRRAEDKADYEIAAARVRHIKRTGGKFYTGQEVMRELGLSD
jgi:hypothetical protein